MTERTGSSFFIVPAAEKDVPELIRIGEECGLSEWSAAGYIQELKRPQPIVWAIRSESEVIGLLVARISLAENGGDAELFNIAVMTEYRGKGIGGRALDMLIEQCQARQVSKIWLDVRISNTPAKSLYKSRGFTEISVRKSFYTKPVEDSATMMLELNARPENP